MLANTSTTNHPPPLTHFFARQQSADAFCESILRSFFLFSLPRVVTLRARVSVFSFSLERVLISLRPAAAAYFLPPRRYRNQPRRGISLRVSNAVARNAPRTGPPYQKQGLASNNFTLPAAIRTRVHVTLPGMIAESRDMLPALEPLVPSTSPFSSSSAPRVTRPFRSR